MSKILFGTLYCKCVVLLADTITIMWYHHHSIFCKGKNFAYYFVNITNITEEGKNVLFASPSQLKWDDLFASFQYKEYKSTQKLIFFFRGNFPARNAAGLVSSVCGNRGNEANCNPVPRWGGRSVCSVTVPHGRVCVCVCVCVCVWCVHAEVMKFGRSPGALTTSVLLELHVPSQTSNNIFTMEPEK